MRITPNKFGPGRGTRAFPGELATLLGGHVELESELGKGSTFSVTLPVQLRRQSGAEAQDGERDWGWNGAGGAANEQHAGQA